MTPWGIASRGLAALVRRHCALSWMRRLISAAIERVWESDGTFQLCGLGALLSMVSALVVVPGVQVIRTVEDE